jgi:hypothetical protein
MVRIGNTGMGHGYNCHAVLRSGDVRFTVSDSAAAYGLIPKGDSASNAADLFTVYADGTIPPETPIPCTLHYYADGGYVRSEPFTVIVGELRATDPIPDGPRQPTLYYAYDDGDVMYSEHPNFSWVEVNGVGTQMSFAQNDDVTMIPIPAAFGPVKLYGQRYTQLSISADGWVACGNYTNSNYSNTGLPSSSAPPAVIALNWDDLRPESEGSGYVYYYHDAANHRFVIEYDSVEYYSNSNRDKFEVVIYDTTVATESGDNAILVQYLTANGYSSSTLGIQNSSMTIGIQSLLDGNYHKACLPVAAGRAILYTTNPPFPSGVADEYSLTGDLSKVRLAAYPNPFRGSATISWGVQLAGNVSLKLYDAAGREVRNLVGRGMNPGRYTVTWDGRSNDGKRVAEGIYFCKLSTATGMQQQKVVVAR